MNKITKLSFKERLGYGVGDTASHFVWDMVGFWILVYSTDIFGISAVVAVTIKDYFKHCKNFSVQYR